MHMATFFKRKSTIFLLIVLISNCLAQENNHKKAFVEVVTYSNDAHWDENSSTDDSSYEDDTPSPKSKQKGVARKNQLIPPYGDVPDEYRRVCIFPNWSVVRESEVAKIYPEDINPFMCTHIHYAYANIDVGSFQLTPSQFQDSNAGDHGAPLYERIIKLKEKNPKLKILVSIGGWFAKSTPFNKILTSTTTRNTFIQNSLNFLRHWQFDGLDVHWIYPGAIELGASADSKQRFTSLIKHINKAFKDEYKSNFKKLILSAFVPPDETQIDAGYQVKQVCKYVDYISVATYDYTGPYDSKTGYNSPLYSRTNSQSSVNSSMYYWIDRGCPAKKLLLGLPTYARAFKIVKKNSPNLVYLGIDSEPFVDQSLYTSEEGILSYYEVCEMLSNKENRVYWDDFAEVPFAIISNTNNTRQLDDSNLWISYEDSRSARKKAEYVKRVGLGGVSIWSLDMDDFKGLFCNLGAFPIIESIKEEFEHKLLPLNPDFKYKNHSNSIYEQIDKEHGSKKQSNENNKDQNNNKKPYNNINIINNNNNKYSTLSPENNQELNYKNLRTNYTKDKKASTPPNKNKFEKLFTTEKMKKFKAIREIKIVACLDKSKCHLDINSGSSILLLYNKIIFAFSTLYFMFYC